jgi:beta-lactamase regulating signal transducer with metallopeptidase domain
MTAWVITWLWHGIALAAVVAFVLRCTPRLNGATRHMIWSGALLAVAVLGWTSWPRAEVTDFAASDAIYIPSAPDFLISLFVGIWAALALVNLIRLVPALHSVYALRDRCRPFPQSVESRLSLWCEVRRHGRHADLMVCDSVPSATVLGLQRPCIAIPSALIQALTIDELDQVILHEHAHIQRRDDWARLAEALLLSVLCVHPAATFIARAMNREREMACDEWVVAHTGQRKAYARCLARAAEIRRRIGNNSTLVPALLGRRHELVRRVERVLAIQGMPRRNVSLGSASVATCVIALMAMQSHELRFAEIASILFPMDHVRQVQLGQWVPKVDWVQQVQQVRSVQQVQRVQQVQMRSVQQVRPVQDAAANVDNAPTEPEAASASIASIASSTPIAPIAASAPTAAIPRLPPVALSRWTFASPGIELASAAKKTSIGVANVFSRAGVSLARSF